MVYGDALGLFCYILAVLLDPKCFARQAFLGLDKVVQAVRPERARPGLGT